MTIDRDPVAGPDDLHRILVDSVTVGTRVTSAPRADFVDSVLAHSVRWPTARRLAKLARAAVNAVNAVPPAG